MKRLLDNGVVPRNAKNLVSFQITHAQILLQSMMSIEWRHSTSFGNEVLPSSHCKVAGETKCCFQFAKQGMHATHAQYLMLSAYYFVPYPGAYCTYNNFIMSRYNNIILSCYLGWKYTTSPCLQRRPCGNSTSFAGKWSKD